MLMHQPPNLNPTHLWFLTQLQRMTMKMLKTSPMTVFHQHTEDKDEAEADADARTTKFELDPSLVFNPATENDDEDVEDEPNNGVSSTH